MISDRELQETLFGTIVWQLAEAATAAAEAGISVGCVHHCKLCLFQDENERCTGALRHLKGITVVELANNIYTRMGKLCHD